jgi:hypothetical protein
LIVQTPNIDHFRNVFTFYPHRGPGFAQEAGCDLWVIEPGVQELDGDSTIQLEVLRCEDNPHAATSKHPLKRVLAQNDVTRLGFAWGELRIRRHGRP